MYCRELPERGWQLLSVPSLEMRHRGYATFTRITEKSVAGRGSAVAPELGSDGATGEFVVASLPTAFLPFLLNLRKAGGREEEEQLQFLIFLHNLLQHLQPTKYDK